MNHAHALAFIRRRVRLELELLDFIEGSHDMASPEFDTLVQAIANLSAAAPVAAKALADHAAAAVDAAQFASLASQVQASVDQINQAIAANPAPAQG